LIIMKLIMDMGRAAVCVKWVGQGCGHGQGGVGGCVDEEWVRTGQWAGRHAQVG